MRKSIHPESTRRGSLLDGTCIQKCNSDLYMKQKVQIIHLAISINTLLSHNSQLYSLTFIYNKV